MTSNKLSVDEIIKRAVDLNARYYSGLGQLMTNYFRDLVITFADVTATQTQTQSPPRTNPAAQKAPQTPVMVLEAEAGAEALGVLVVDNHLAHDVSTRIVPSVFVDASHNEVKPEFAFDPEAVTLRPGEQILVRVKVRIDHSFAPEARYLGYLSIPDLAGTKVPIVLRRRLSSPEGTSS
jgi:hypothetical protein